MRSAAGLVDLMAHTAGGTDLSDLRVLDFGCGTKIVKHLIETDVALLSYLGIDTEAEVIEFLDSAVADPRFRFVHLGLRNDLYNPDGVVMSDLVALPVDPGSIDLITLFSVFTHLDPDDFHDVLRLLRPTLAPGGRLLGTVYLNEPSDGLYGAVDTQVVEGSIHGLDRLRIGHDLPTSQALRLHHAALGNPEVVADRRTWLRNRRDESYWPAFATGLEEALPDPVTEAALSQIFLPPEHPEIEVLRSSIGPNLPKLHQFLTALTEPIALAPEVAHARFGQPRQDFVDLFPKKPLLAAVFTRSWVEQAVEEEGFRIIDWLAPTAIAQHGLVLEIQ